MGSEATVEKYEPKMVTTKLVIPAPKIIQYTIGKNELSSMLHKFNICDWYQTIFQYERTITEDVVVSFLKNAKCRAYKQEGGDVIGVLGIHNMKWKNGTADVFPMFFVAPDHVARATAISFFKRWAFEECGVRKLKLTLLSHDKMCEEFKEAGFDRVGLQKKEIFVSGKFRDTLSLELINENYNK